MLPVFWGSKSLQLARCHARSSIACLWSMDSKQHAPNHLCHSKETEVQVSKPQSLLQLHCIKSPTSVFVNGIKPLRAQPVSVVRGFDQVQALNPSNFELLHNGLSLPPV